MANNNDKAQQNVARQALDQLRNRLLDLTARNRLLNFRHSKKSSLRVVDEIPDQLLGLLLSEKELRFAPVPLPTREQLIDAEYLSFDEETGKDTVLRESPSATQWAVHLGIKVDYELIAPEAAPEPVVTPNDEIQAGLFSDPDLSVPGAVSADTGDIAPVVLPVPVEKPITPARHKDTVIQTLLYPDHLEAVVRTLFQKAESAVQEMGTNILYLSFGFLEWFEADQSETPRIAPLLLLPVTIEKGRLNKQAGTFEYRLTYSGEDIVANLSLHEKLKNDFGLALPDLIDPGGSKDDSTLGTAETYFNSVAGILKLSKPDWCVRRYVSLSLLNFHKLLMYLDLDPDRWPDESGLASHPVVKQFLGADYNAEPATASGFSVEHDIDTIDDVHRSYPLIYDADSSQHSAIIDVLDGKSLVIEGPPGTGKSQSITNLIAAAISDGKRVLFVAEKLAALEVVKSRLDRAGLGDFCLELHSHKTQKRQFLNSIADRLNALGEYRDASQIDSDINRYEKLKRQLKAHVDLISTHWKDSQLTPYQIFTAATRYRDSLPLTLAELANTGVDRGGVDSEHSRSPEFTPQTRQQTEDQIDRYQQVFSSVESQLQAVDGIVAPGLSHHPWYGVRRDNLMHAEVSSLTEALASWQAALQQLIQVRDSLADQLQCVPTEVADSVDSLSDLAEGLQSLPALNANITKDALPHLDQDVFIACQRELSQFEKMNALSDALLPALKAQLSDNSLPIDAMKLCAEKLGGRLANDVTFGEAGQMARLVTGAISDGDKLYQQIQQAATDVAAHTQTVLGHSSINSIALSRKILSLLADLDPHLSERRHHRMEDDQIDDALEKLTKSVASVHQQKNSLSGLFDIRKLGDEGRLSQLQESLDKGGVLGWFNSDWRAARATLKSIAAAESVSVGRLREGLPLAIRFATECTALNNHDEYARLLGEQYDGVNTDASGLALLRAWYKNVSAELPGDLARGLTELPADAEQKLRHLIDRNALGLMQEIIQTVRKIRPALQLGDLLHNDDIPLLGDNGALQPLSLLFDQNINDARGVFGSDNVSVAEMNQQLTTVESLAHVKSQWFDSVNADSALEKVFQIDAQALVRNGAEHGAIHSTISFVADLNASNVCEAVKTTVMQSPQQYTIDELHAVSTEVEAGLGNFEEALNVFVAAGDVSLNDWQLHCGTDLGLLSARNSNALDNKSSLMQWMSYKQSAAQLGQLGLAGMATSCERGDLPVHQINDAYLALAYDQLALEVLRECPPLAEFSGDIQQSLREQFAVTDQKIHQLQRERIAWKADQNDIPQGVSGAYVSELTELKLLRHECNKKTRHIPIRQLLSRASSALVQLKPCFMMGPLSAAQYLKPGQIEFDLVIMDEASQIKPEDSLGVIARGRQLVVVGDPKQLPPTNFFDRVVHDEDEEATVLGEQESILDATIPMFNSRRLRWHYRSQHESLIAFSNQNFYDNDLVLFPSPARQSEEYGVKHVLVNGVFVNRTNVEEANAIAEAVALHFQQYPQDSVGVVAMNSNQRELIDATLESKAKDDLVLREALERNQESEEPLFIKNLENVQGDERDVIFISMTYGPPQQGARVYQRFGPINSDTGWRRLNVLLTRSRKRMKIFTSMASSDIVAGESSRRGVVALRDLLAYLETGIVHNTRQTGRQPDSDFEIAVIERLEQRGYSCVPQIGVAGFFIDIAVIDPANEGHYLMGIECDGATYHSARTVRDRDRLREAVLERLGWRIKRVWSTDWFKNPDAEIQRVVHELELLVSQASTVTNVPVLDNTVPHEVDSDVMIKSEGDTDEWPVAIEPMAEAPLKTEALSPAVVRDLPKALAELALEIETDFPDHGARQRLLRGSMQEALLEFKPTTIEAFEAQIPGFLRRSIAAAEFDRYLPRVLATIEAAREG